MTSEQRYDLAIEWRLTSSEIRRRLKQEYEKKYGENSSVDQWEEFLVEALNIKPFWISVGLL